MSDTARVTYLLVDGENIDATLGMSVLGRKPDPDDRPRWDAVLRAVRERWGAPVVPLFFLNVVGRLPSSFVQALVAQRWTPVPLSGPEGMKVVDVGILRTLEAIEGRPGDVVLASHDADFAERITSLLGQGRRVAMLGFPEFMARPYHELAREGLELIDMEHDARGFLHELPRITVLDAASFDPARFLDRPPVD